MTKYIFIFFACLSFAYANETTPSYQPQMKIENYIDKKLEQEFCSRPQKEQKDILSNLTSQAQNAAAIQAEPEHKQFYNAFEYLPQEAAYKLAVIHSSSLCYNPDYKQAETYIQKSLIKPDAYYAYGMILLRQKKEWNKAYEYFYNAGDLGIKQGYYNAAVMLYQKNASANMNKIFSLLKKSAAMHYERALLDVSIISLIYDKENIVYAFYQNNHKHPTVLNNFNQILTYLSDKNYPYAHYNKAVLLYKNKKQTPEIFKHLAKLDSKSFPELPIFVKILKDKQKREAKINSFFAIEYANSMDVEKYGMSINPKNMLR